MKKMYYWLMRNSPRSNTLHQHDSNQSIIIKPSDKSKKLVGMKQSVSLQKAEQMLADTKAYEQLSLSIDEFQKSVKDILLKECKQMDPTLLKSILPNDTRFPEWYSLPEDHKKDLPLRSVVGACDGPTTGISIVLERILHQLLPYVTGNLLNTTESLKDIETKCPGLRAPADTVLVTMDVAGLYSNRRRSGSGHGDHSDSPS